MKTLGAVLHEIAGLVVEDGSLAVGVIGVTALISLLQVTLRPNPTLVAVLLLAGLVGVLVENVLRSARRTSRL